MSNDDIAVIIVTRQEKEMLLDALTGNGPSFICMGTCCEKNRNNIKWSILFDKVKGND